jgi:serine/threonine-protein kinase
LYEAVSGRRAFPGDDAVGVASRIQTEEPLPIARSLGLDAKVDAVLSRGMCKNADKRFSSCAELGHAFSNALDAREPELRSAQVTVPDAHHRALASGQISASRRVRIALGGLLAGVLLTLLVMRLASELRTTEPLPAASVEPATTSEVTTDNTAEEAVRETSPGVSRPSRTDSVQRGSAAKASPGSSAPPAKKSAPPEPRGTAKPDSSSLGQGPP